MGVGLLDSGVVCEVPLLTPLVLTLLSLSSIASTETGRKWSLATTTHWAWRSTLATMAREGRTRPSCTWCCPRRPTTAESPAITRWRERVNVWSVARLLPGLNSLVSLGSQSLSQLTCSYELENQTRFLSCDLGNPMKSGTNVRVHHLSA